MFNVTTDLSLLILVIGIIAFMVSVIIQVVKGVTLFKSVPTDLLVFVLSIVLTVLALLAYASYAKMMLVWYMIVAAVLVGFIVALVAMQGWTKVMELANRFIKKGE